MLSLEDASRVSKGIDAVIIDASKRAEKCVADLNKVVRSYWDSILAYIDSGPDPSTTNEFFRTRTLRYEYEVGLLIDQAATDIVYGSYRNTFAAIAEVYDDEYLRSVNLIEGAPSTSRRRIPAKPVKTRTMRAKVILKTNPSQQEIEEFLQKRGYKTRLRKWSKKVTDAEMVQRIIADGIASGKTRKEIAEDIRPYVQNLASSATRIVRTECAYAHNHFSLKSMERFGDNLLGWQVTNPLDTHTRKEHRRRAEEPNTNYLAGRIYWKNLNRKYNIKNRVVLPDEPNCRCGWRPVLRSQADAYKAETRELAASTKEVNRGTKSSQKSSRQVSRSRR